MGAGQYDHAKKTSNRAEMIRLLTQVDVEDAAWSADTSLRRAKPNGD